MAYLDDEDTRDALDLKMRVVNFIGNKTDKGIEKGLITPDEAKTICKTVEKLVKKHDVEWWLDEKGFKSIEIVEDLLNEADFGTCETEKEILEKLK